MKSTSQCSVCWDSVGGVEKVEGAKCGAILAMLSLEVVPEEDYPPASSNTCTMVCCCLCCTSLRLFLPLLVLCLPLLPWLCHDLQRAGQHWTH